MDLKEYIKNSQPVLDRLLFNYKKNSSFPQAILLNSPNEVPVFDIAKYIAKYFFCSNNDFPCNTCVNCKQIDNNEFLDLIIIDGSSKNILKEEISSLIERFSKKSVDNYEFYIYIINLAEKMTKEAINALLKFLEEPSLNVHAILTTKNISKVIPTIVSRCQTINLVLSSKDEIIEKCLIKGVDIEDAEILSNFFVDEETIFNKYKNKEYIEMKELTKIYLTTLLSSFDEAQFILESKIIELTKTDNQVRNFIDLIVLFLKDAANIGLNSSIILKSNEILLKNLYNRLVNIDNSILLISELKNDLDINVNKTLILEQLHHILVRV